MGTRTPWGEADYSQEIARGIMQYSTPSHGGIHLSPARQAEMPEELRLDSGWYEEDCGWSLVAVAYPQYFVKDYALALEIVKHYYPERYKRYFNISDEK